jgi:hypothetical protein
MVQNGARDRTGVFLFVLYDPAVFLETDRRVCERQAHQRRSSVSGTVSAGQLLLISPT